MKLSPHRNFPRLGKWVPFFQQEKITVDYIDYKEINATELQKICALMLPSKEDIQSETDSYAFLHPNKDANPLPQHSELPRMSPSKFDRIDSCIKKFGLEENIVLKTTSNHSSGNLKIKGVAFRNLKIEGDVDINFSSLKTIEFTNSKFSDNVNIGANDATDAIVTFDGNKFSKNFRLIIHDVHPAFITNNEISGKMSVNFDFTPPPNDPDKCEIKKGPGEMESAELLIYFFKNKIDDLLIADGSNLFNWHKQNYPFKKIKFRGGNHIRILSINTKYIVLAFHRQLKVNGKLISFSESDKIGVSSPEGARRPTFTMDYNYKLYVRFFSLLEAQAFKQYNRITKEMYNRKVRYFNKKLSAIPEDRIIFDWTNSISKDGTSWIRPLLWLIAFQALLAIITYYFFSGYDLKLGEMCPSSLNIMCTSDLGEMCTPYFDKALASDLKECTPHFDKGLIPFLGLFAWFMNPVSLLPSIKITMTSAGIYIIFLFQKLFSALFYYEIVKALRRFSR